MATHTPEPWINDDGLVTGRETRERLGRCSVDIFDAGNWPEALSDQAHANARLIAEAPALAAGLDGTLNLLRRAQDILTGYLIPDGYDPDRAVTLLLELLDGPEQRAVEIPARAALARATGDTP